jgi:hypothetical protein
MKTSKIYQGLLQIWRAMRGMKHSNFNQVILVLLGTWQNLSHMVLLHNEIFSFVPKKKEAKLWHELIILTNKSKPINSHFFIGPFRVHYILCTFTDPNSLF